MTPEEQQSLKQFEYGSYVNTLSNEQIQTVLRWARAEVMDRYPHAALTFIRDRKAHRNYAVIADCAIELNANYHVKSRNKYAPPLLSAVIRLKDGLHPRDRLIAYMEAWISANFHILYPWAPSDPFAESRVSQIN